MNLILTPKLQAPLHHSFVNRSSRNKRGHFNTQGNKKGATEVRSAQGFLLRHKH